MWSHSSMPELLNFILVSLIQSGWHHPKHHCISSQVIGIPVGKAHVITQVLRKKRAKIVSYDTVILRVNHAQNRSSLSISTKSTVRWWWTKHRGNSYLHCMKPYFWPMGYNVWECGWLQHWCRTEMPSSFILTFAAGCGPSERELGGIEWETTGKLTLTYSTRDLTILSIQDSSYMCNSWMNGVAQL